MVNIRYLALGDSYTSGEQVTEPERWSVQLTDLLGSKGIQVQLTIIAHNEWTTDELMALTRGEDWRSASPS